MSKKVLILYTGGTIGMEPSSQGYRPGTGLASLLEQQLSHSTRSALPEYSLIEMPELIDSSNLQPAHWTAMGQQLLRHWADYDGFVVLHGTDTMAYTASALSFMFTGCDKPIIVTGSQIPLAQARSDGVENLASALAFACYEALNEVCLYFGGRLLRGNRASKVASDGFTAFDSPNYPWLGDAGIHLRLNNALILPASSPDFHVPVFESGKVLVLPVYPGMPGAALRPLVQAAGIEGILLQTYGVGNPPDADAEFVALLEDAADDDLLLMNISHCHMGHMAQGAYASGSILNTLGVISGNDMTLEAAVAKLNMALHSGPRRSDQRNWLSRAVCGERSD